MVKDGVDLNRLELTNLCQIFANIFVMKETQKMYVQ